MDVLFPLNNRQKAFRVLCRPSLSQEELSSMVAEFCRIVNQSKNFEQTQLLIAGSEEDEKSLLGVVLEEECLRHFLPAIGSSTKSVSRIADLWTNLFTVLESLRLLSSTVKEVKLRQTTPFDFTSPDHLHSLQRLWFTLQGEDENSPELSKTAVDWRLLGFQTESDPASDFRGAGILALDHLLHIADTSGAAARHILWKFSAGRYGGLDHLVDSRGLPVVSSSNSTDPKDNSSDQSSPTPGTGGGGYFPFALIGINITQFIVELLMERRLHRAILSRTILAVQGVADEHLALLRSPVLPTIISALDKEERDALLPDPTDLSPNLSPNNTLNLSQILNEVLVDNGYAVAIARGLYSNYSIARLGSAEAVKLAMQEDRFAELEALRRAENEETDTSTFDALKEVGNAFVSVLGFGKKVSSPRTPSSSTGAVMATFASGGGLPAALPTVNISLVEEFLSTLPSQDLPSQDPTLKRLALMEVHDAYRRVFEEVYLRYVVEVPSGPLAFGELFERVKKDFRTQLSPLY